MSSHFSKTGTDVPKARGGYNNGVRGRVNVRYNGKRGSYRYRFQPIYPDQATTINLALAIVREEIETEYDSVALENICLYFLSTYSFPQSKKAEGDKTDCN